MKISKAKKAKYEDMLDHMSFADWKDTDDLISGLSDILKKRFGVQLVWVETGNDTTCVLVEDGKKRITKKLQDEYSNAYEYNFKRDWDEDENDD